jgi:arylsulfatase A-like enzyme
LLLAVVWNCGRREGVDDAQGYNETRPTVDRILIISIDAVRPDHLSCYGYPRSTTPSIDRIAEDGILFTHAYAQANWTKPSIASLFTGLYVRHHGVVVGSTFIDTEGNVRKGDISYPLPGHLPVIAEVFRQSGFRTGGFVENSHLVPSQGFARGFETYDRKKPAALNIQRWIESLESTDRVFAFIHLIGPHDPYDRTPDETFSVYRDQKVDFTNLDYKKRKDLTEEDIREAISLYDSELSYFDGEHVAPLIEWLRNTGRYDDFLILVTSDHGEELYDNHGWAHGHSLFEEVVRVPLIVKLPSRLKNEAVSPGTHLSEIVEIIDIFPTLADLAGINAPADIDGDNISELMFSDRAVDRDAFAISEYGRSFATHVVGATLIQDDLKLIERYHVPFGPKVAGFGRAAESRVYAIDGMSEVALSGDQAQIALSHLRQLLHQTIGADNALSPRLSAEVSLSDEEVEELRALGYIDE